MTSNARLFKTSINGVHKYIVANKRSEAIKQAVDIYEKGSTASIKHIEIDTIVKINDIHNIELV